MNNLDLFMEALKARVTIKTNQGQKARIAEFDSVVKEVTAVKGPIPDIARVRAYFVQCLSHKPNWGCRQVIQKLDYSVAQIKEGER
ncbi:MAG: hypothetical protein V7771_16820 [Shewanella psychromarinicola]|uniref:hypothetical protein n=1 Tax=Shewanella psychromarinicola TaxID=2487742 RepID=UPI003001B05B